MTPAQKDDGSSGYGQGYAYFGMALNFTIAILLFGAGGWFLDGWVHTLPLFTIIGGAGRRGAANGRRVRNLAVLAGLGIGLVVAATLLGGKPAAIGGGVALLAQLWAVALLRPRMRAPNPEFMARWLGGMGIRLLGVGAVLIVSATLPALLGYLGVLLPLLFLETRFLR